MSAVALALQEISSVTTQGWDDEKCPTDFLTPSKRMVDDFYRRRALSLSDLIEPQHQILESSDYCEDGLQQLEANQLCDIPKQSDIDLVAENIVDLEPIDMGNYTYPKSIENLTGTSAPRLTVRHPSPSRNVVVQKSNSAIVSEHPSLHNLSHVPNQTDQTNSSSNGTSSGETIRFMYERDSVKPTPATATTNAKLIDGTIGQSNIQAVKGFSGCFADNKFDEEASGNIVSFYLGNHNGTNLHDWNMYDTNPHTSHLSSSTAYTAAWVQQPDPELSDFDDTGSVVHHSQYQHTDSLFGPTVLSLRRMSSLESDPGDLHVSPICVRKRKRESDVRAISFGRRPQSPALKQDTTRGEAIQYEHDLSIHAMTQARIATASPATLAQYPGRISLQIPHRQPGTINCSFGNPRHANGELMNTAFVPDERMSNSHTTDVPLHKHPSFVALLQHAEQKLQNQYQKTKDRTSAQSMVRRQIHRECALARLEGVPIGYYRYFAGGLTVEDYLKAQLCVCWERCYCQKLCSRFGDVICPCSKDIVPFEP